MTNRVLPARLRPGTGASLIAGLIAVLLMFMASGAISYLNTRMLRRDAALITHSYEVLSTLDEILSLAKDAETGQRGYLITGDEKYLDPYAMALARIDEELADLERLTRNDPAQLARIPALKAAIERKLLELNETLSLRRKQGFEAARESVNSDRGKSAMDAIRAQFAAMRESETALLGQRSEEMESAYDVAVRSGILTGCFGILASLSVAYLLRRAAQNRWRQEWMQAGQIGLSQAIAGNQRCEQLAENVLRYLADYLDAHAGAFFIKEADFRRAAAYGVPAGNGTPERFELNHGLLGQAAKQAKTILVQDVPEGYLTVGSALGQGKPRQIIIVPTLHDGEVNAVFELGFIHPGDELIAEFLAKVSESIGMAVRASITARTCKTCWKRPSDKPKSCRLKEKSCESPTRNSRSKAGRCESRKAAWKTSKPNSSRPTPNWKSRPCSWRRRKTSPAAPSRPWRSKPENWSRPAATSRTFLPTCRTNCARRSIRR